MQSGICWIFKRISFQIGMLTDFLLWQLCAVSVFRQKSNSRNKLRWNALLHLNMQNNIALSSFDNFIIVSLSHIRVRLLLICTKIYCELVGWLTDCLCLERRTKSSGKLGIWFPSSAPPESWWSKTLQLGLCLWTMWS